MADSCKRFKACKIRVNTQSTKGKKTTRHVRLNSKNYCKISQESSSSKQKSFTTGMEEEHVYGSNIDDINSSHESDDQAFSSLSRYHLRRVKEYHSWEDVRGSLLQARIEEEAFCDESIMCIECHNNFAVCRCVDCGPRQLFCINCAKTIHEQRNVFHLLEIFKDGCFVPLFVNHGVLTLDHQRNCPTAQAQNIICIDEKGHQHLKWINFCNCEDAAVTLVKFQLWPGSAVRPQVAFHFKLVTLAETLLLECHVSLKKFCDVLGLNKSNMLPVWVKNLYKILNDDSFDEFRYHQHLFKTMKQFVLQQKPDNVCPLCPLQSETDTDKNVAIECMDGCFGLVRKKSAGANLLPARHNGTFFANQDDVDSFVDDNSKKAKQAPTDCNEFKSGEVSNMLRSKGRNKLFDEKGVFGRVCRHEYPRGFMSIKHGERIAYSVYEVKKLLCHYDEDTDVKIMYDIACTLSAHLKKNEEHTILGRIDLAIPVFHAYGHKSSCQVAFGPRRKEGFGLTDGEGIERLWSYLRGFSSMTKEMTAGRRVDVLTDALLHHARHRLLQFGPALLSKMQKTKKLMENSVVQLEQIFSDLKVSYGTDVINSWMKAEENMLLMRGKRKPSPMSWEAKYVQNLVFLQELRQGIASTEAENHETINELVKRKKAFTGRFTHLLDILVIRVKKQKQLIKKLCSRNNIFHI